MWSHHLSRKDGAGPVMEKSAATIENTGRISASPGRRTSRGRGASAKHSLGEDQLLPAVCPLCSALGVKPRSLRKANAKTSSLVAHYCEVCNEHIDRETTRFIALVSGLLLGCLSLATASALYFGARQVGLQFLVVAGFALVLTQGSGKLFRDLLSPGSTHGVWETDDEQGRAVVCLASQYSEVLTEHGIPFLKFTSEKPPSLISRISLALILVGTLWLGALQAFSAARVRVLMSGSEPAYLLVDDRKADRILPKNSEGPGLGKSIRVLGGRRSLGLVTESGAVLASETLTLWPGSTYIVGYLPAGRCLFWEVRQYGENPGRFLMPIAGNGPVWRLDDQVDSWFVPLAETGPEDQAPDFQGSGGVRRALRLLGCSGKTVEPL